jgi:hypothetical protein
MAGLARILRTDAALQIVSFGGLPFLILVTFHGVGVRDSFSQRGSDPSDSYRAYRPKISATIGPYTGSGS